MILVVRRGVCFKRRRQAIMGFLSDAAITGMEGAVSLALHATGESW